jgi:hypothetical protein
LGSTPLSFWIFLLAVYILLPFRRALPLQRLDSRSAQRSGTSTNGGLAAG